MQIGVSFPRQDLTEVSQIRDFVQAVEEIGYQHFSTLDHVVVPDPAAHPGRRLPYDINSVVHEPMTMLAYVAALTTKMELVTAVIILPQRQAALVAKQAAELDVLTNGRFRLGIGVGYVDIEFDALDMNFHDRGKRVEEQIEVMRLLWTQQTVTFHGENHKLDGVGLNPMPIQRPIPIWIGGSDERALRRAARLADGIFPQRPLGSGWPETMDMMRGWMVEAGRDPSKFGIEGKAMLQDGDPDSWRAQVKPWQEIGAKHVTVYSGEGKSLDEHIKTLREAYPALAAL